MTHNRLCISEIIKIRVADTATLILFNLLIYTRLRGTPHSPHSQPHGYPHNQEPNHPHHSPHHSPRPQPHPLSTSPTPHIQPHIQPHNHPHHSPHNHPRNNKNLLALRHSIHPNHVAAVSQAHCIVNLERMVERSLEPVKILVLRLAPLNLAER